MPFPPAQALQLTQMPTRLEQPIHIAGLDRSQTQMPTTSGQIQLSRTVSAEQLAPMADTRMSSTQPQERASSLTPADTSNTPTDVGEGGAATSSLTARQTENGPVSSEAKSKAQSCSDSGMEAPVLTTVSTAPPFLLSACPLPSHVRCLSKWASSETELALGPSNLYQNPSSKSLVPFE